MLTVAADPGRLLSEEIRDRNITASGLKMVWLYKWADFGWRHHGPPHRECGSGWTERWVDEKKKSEKIITLPNLKRPYLKWYIWKRSRRYIQCDIVNYLKELSEDTIIRWQRIGCVVVKISETLNVSLTEALDMFYKSETCRRFHDEETGLYLQGNLYVLNDFLAEISKPVA